MGLPLMMKAAVSGLMLGLMLGAVASHLFYAPRLELANLRAAELTSRLEEQNAAIQRLTVDAEAMASKAKQAVERAEGARADADRAARSLMSLKQPADTTDCDAAAGLIRKELGL